MPGARLRTSLFNSSHERNSRLLCATVIHLCLCIGHSAAFLWAAVQGLVDHALEPYGAATYFNGHWAGGWKTAQIVFLAGNVRTSPLIVKSLLKRSSLGCMLQRNLGRSENAERCT